MVAGSRWELAEDQLALGRNEDAIAAAERSLRDWNEIRPWRATRNSTGPTAVAKEPGSPGEVSNWGRRRDGTTLPPTGVARPLAVGAGEAVVDVDALRIDAERLSRRVGR